MSKQLERRLECILKRKENVIIEGPHGCGKTAIITSLFNNTYGEGNWVWFSAPTMDPFVDFIGCPKEKKGADGHTYLDLVRPERFAKDQVKAIFIDEFNRAPKKVKNALMELLQFKQINGHKFNNLEVIWAAVNPSTEDYDVEEIDLAQLDRFHCFIKVSGDVSENKDYFKDKYDKSHPGIAHSAVEWWKQLPKELRAKVSSRRLDYVLDGFLNKNANVFDYLPDETNPQKLMDDLKLGNIDEIIQKLTTKEEKIEFFKKENNFTRIKPKLKDKAFLVQYMVFMPAEKISMIIADCENLSTVYTGIRMKHHAKEELENFKEICKSIVEADNDKGVVEKIQKANIVQI